MNEIKGIPSELELEDPGEFQVGEEENDDGQMLKKVHPHKQEGGFGLLFSRNEVLSVPIWQITLIMLLCWFTASFTYYGLALNTGSLAGDFYLNMYSMRLHLCLVTQ